MTFKPYLKNVFFLFVVLVVASLFMSVKSSGNADPQIQSTLQGTWKLLDGEYVDEQGVIKQYQDLKLTDLKVLNANHFSFISVADGKFWASGAGEYQVHGNRYQETLSLASSNHKDNPGFVFQFRLEKDLWITERFDANGKRVELERWQRQ